MNASYVGRDPVRALIAAFETRLGRLDAVRMRSRPWASATFVGVRVSVSFVVAPDAALDAFLAEIAEADLPLHRAFVADITVGAPVARGGGTVRVEVEALVIDDL